MTVFAKCYAKIFIKLSLSMFCTKQAVCLSVKSQQHKIQARRQKPAGLVFNTRFRRRIHLRIHPQ